MTKKRVIAAFDFDGTISNRDSLIPFLFNLAGWKAFIHLFFLLPTFILFWLGRLDRQRSKERILTSFIRGKSREELAREGERFAKGRLRDILRTKALERIHWHQERGDSLVLVSASCDFYLHPWAKSEGFEMAITSQLAYDEEGRATGRLLGVNCRGAEKTRRLLELYPNRTDYILFAYGDSDGDQELLAMADHRFYRPFDDEGR